MQQQQQQQQLQKQQPLSVLLVGKSGSGKSSVGNALLRNPNAFPVGDGFDSTTLTCQMEQNDELIVVDTPDLSKFIGDEDEARRMLQDALNMNGLRFDAILLVMRLDVRLTEEEMGVAHLVQTLFGCSARSNIIFVFTHIDSVAESDEAFVLFMQRRRKDFPELDNLLISSGERFAMMNAGSACNQETLNSQRQNLLILMMQVTEKRGSIDACHARHDTKAKASFGSRSMILRCLYTAGSCFRVFLHYRRHFIVAGCCIGCIGLCVVLAKAYKNVIATFIPSVCFGDEHS